MNQQKYIAKFTAQAWIGDYAQEIEPHGPDAWDCSAYMLALTPEQHEAALIPDDYGSDNVRDDPAAPEWVRQWAGPFYITVTLED